MLIIGLTGGIGSGKTTVANLFAQLGVTVIDTDQLSRDVTQPGQLALEKIVKRFGSTILLPNGSLDRAALRHIIFNDSTQKQWLENLLHPLIREEMSRLVKLATSPYCLIVIPLLAETHPNPLIQRVLVVDADEQHQIERTLQRDNVSTDSVNAILSSQVTRAKRLAIADDVIENNDSFEKLKEKVEKLHAFYIGLSRDYSA